MKALNQKNVLAFQKNTLVELNATQMRDIDSGISPFFVGTLIGYGVIKHLLSDEESTT